jgi:hypothetical protein
MKSGGIGSWLHQVARVGYRACSTAIRQAWAPCVGAYQARAGRGATAAQRRNDVTIDAVVLGDHSAWQVKGVDGGADGTHVDHSCWRNSVVFWCSGVLVF